MTKKEKELICWFLLLLAFAGVTIHLVAPAHFWMWFAPSGVVILCLLVWAHRNDKRKTQAAEAIRAARIADKERRDAWRADKTVEVGRAIFQAINERWILAGRPRELKPSLSEDGWTVTIKIGDSIEIFAHPNADHWFCFRERCQPATLYRYTTTAPTPGWSEMKFQSECRAEEFGCRILPFRLFVWKAAVA